MKTAASRRLMMSHFRLDRSLTLAFYLFSKHFPEKIPRIPILMYHSISHGGNPSTERKHPYYETTTSPSVFRKHLRILKERGYKSISLKEAAEILKKGSSLNQRNVVITFDDGFRDFYDEAFPALKAGGFCATMFLPTKYISDSGKTFMNREMLTWAQIRKLQKSGMRFGSHSVTHRKLYHLNPEELSRELLKSRQDIEAHTGAPVDSFSYPFALPDQDRRFLNQLEKLLQQAGYSQGVSTRVGTASGGDPIYFFKRIPANRWDDEHFFKLKLSGAYDWVFGFQKMYKGLKGILKNA